MLDIKRCLIGSTLDLDLADGVSDVREGSCLVAVYRANGELTVTPSTGTATDGAFIGVAMSYLTDIESVAVVDTFTADGAGVATYALSYVPVASSIAVWGGSASLGDPENNAGNVDSANEWHQAGTVLTVQVADDTVIRVQYRRAVTFREGRRRQGDVWPGPHISDVMRRVGVITAGVVYTDEFSTTDYWGGVVTGIGPDAEGRFGVVVAASRVDDYVIQHPRTSDDLLGFAF